MEYYIQGDAARAKEIKAAFEAKGIDTTAFSFDDEDWLYFSSNGLLHFEEFSNTLLNIFKTHPGYTELPLPVKPKFNAWDWVVSNGQPARIYELKQNYYLGKYLNGHDFCHKYADEDKLHLWTIEDAKDGDVLACGDWLFILKQFNVKGNNHKTYCHYDLTLNRFKDDIDSYMVSGSDEYHPATKEQRDLLFAKMKEAGYEWDENKKELKKITVKPKFKVGDWIVQNDNGTVSQITKTINGEDEHGEYRAYRHTNGYFAACVENEYHLWTIKDAKDGDVLVLNGFSKEYKWIGIFKALTSDTSFSSHCHYNCGMCEFVTDIARCTKHGNKYNDIRPATNEERGILFAKMREAGYEWDENKKELHKIQPHYDIANFQPFDKVLVRDRNDEPWRIAFYGYYNEEAHYSHFVGTCWSKQCIPFEGNEHLIGTTDMPDERFINW